MSSNKSWDKNEEDRKEARSIYLTVKDWDYLNKRGKGSVTKVIREVIEGWRSEEQNSGN